LQAKLSFGQEKERGSSKQNANTEHDFKDDSGRGRSEKKSVLRGKRTGKKTAQILFKEKARRDKKWGQLENKTPQTDLLRKKEDETTSAKQREDAKTKIPKREAGRDEKGRDATPSNSNSKRSGEKKLLSTKRPVQPYLINAKTGNSGESL